MIAEIMLAIAIASLLLCANYNRSMTTRKLRLVTTPAVLSLGTSAQPRPAAVIVNGETKTVQAKRRLP